MFTYNGYSEEELINLCNDNLANKGCAPWHYWTSEVYSFGRHYRNYGFYPSFLPLYIYSDHGCGGDQKAYPHELENDAEAMFVCSEEKKQLYSEVSKKPCYTVIAPFVMYRKRNKIKQCGDAKGTLAFPSHSTPEIENRFDISAYIKELKALPDEMQPVCVCLHMHDINKGQHKIYLDNNIPVYTAGNAFDMRFAQRYYDILKHFKYSCSNLIGSYTYYSVEMGIPFSLFGQECKYYNNSDTNLAKGDYDYKCNVYLEAEKLFIGVNHTISEEQKKHMLKYVKPKSAISRLKMSSILWGAYLKRGNLFKDIKYWKKIEQVLIK